MTRLPCSLSSSSRSAMSFTTIAVLLIVSAPDSASAVCQPRRHSGWEARCDQQGAGGRDRHGQHDLQQAKPEDMPAHRPQLGQAELQPDHEHQEHDAELAQVPDAFGVLRQGQRMGTDQHARQQIAQHRRQLEIPADHHANHGGQQVHQCEIERGHGSMLATRLPPVSGEYVHAAGTEALPIKSRDEFPAPTVPATDSEAMLSARTHDLRHRSRRGARSQGPSRAQLRRRLCGRSSRCAAAWS